MKKTALISRAVELPAAVLVVVSLILIQALIGGTRLIFSLPAYAVLGITGLLCLFLVARPKPRPDQLCLTATALLFAYILARALYSPVPYLARTDIYAVLGGLIIYFFVACVFTSAKARMLVVAVLLTASLVHVMVGAIQFSRGNNFMLIPFLQRFDYGRRASGLYGCPNHLAGLLEVVGIFGVSLVWWSRWPVWGKLLIGYAAASCYAGLVLSGSRGGYLSALTSLFVIATLGMTILVRTSAKIFWRVGGAIAMVALLVGLVVTFSVRQNYYLSERTENILGENLSDPSSELRMELWQAALRQWRLQPLIGTGSGTYLYYGRQFRGDQVQSDPIHAHNDYVELLAEYGSVGAVGFVLFLLLHLRRGWKTYWRLGPQRVAQSESHSFLSNGLALNIGALGSVSAYLIHSMFDFNLHIPANLLLLAFVFGVLANPGLQRNAEVSGREWPFWLWRSALPLLGIVLLFQSVRLLPGEYFTEHSRTALRDNDPGSAALSAITALGYEDQNPNLYSYFGRALVIQGAAVADYQIRTSFFEAGLRELQTAHELAPRDVSFITEIGYVYDTLRRFDEGESMYEQALMLDPKSHLLQEDYRAHLERWRTGDVFVRPRPKHPERATAP